MCTNETILASIAKQLEKFRKTESKISAMQYETTQDLNDALK